MLEAEANKEIEVTVLNKLTVIKVCKSLLRTFEQRNIP